MEGNLPKPSRIKLDKLVTIDKNTLLMKLGSIKKEFLEKLRVEIIKVF